MDGDGIGDGGAEADAVEVLEHDRAETADGVDGGVECGFVGYAGGVRAGQGDAAAGGEIEDLLTGSEGDDDADAERMEDGEVEEDVAEVFVIDESAVDEHDEGLAAELRHVAEDAADVVVFHGRGAGEASVGLGLGKSTRIGVWGGQGRESVDSG